MKVFLVKVQDEDDNEYYEKYIRVNESQKALLDCLENANLINYEVIEDKDITDVSGE